MKFYDRNSNSDRIDDEVEPLISALLRNKQLFGEDGSGSPHVTESLKYKSEPQKRRQTDEYAGGNEFVEDIKEIFGFEPLDFQVESWELIDELSARRRRQNHSQAAILSAPTGFGKTEAFLGPIYQMQREDRSGSTIIVYPRRALLQNQFERILKHIHQIRDGGRSPLSVGLYMGDMPYGLDEVRSKGSFFEEENGRPRFKLANCWCSTDDETHSFEYFGTSRDYRIRCENNPDHEFDLGEIVLHREEIKDHTPDILLTTLESLELFSLKPNYNIIDDADTIVFDEVHLYTGLRGAHAAQIVDNIDRITDQNLLYLGASATIDNPERFGKKLFDVGPSLETVDVPESDINRNHDDKEHYHFLISPEDGPGASSMMIQQLMMLGHGMLEQDDWRGKILSFIDSTSQINQKAAQFDNADSTRQLWQYHRSGDGFENWNNLSESMGYDFVDEPLELMRVFADRGFDVDEAAASDLLFSTSFLEVGIDVGDISMVTQYRTPQDLSSFTQRIGRAAREEGMDSHIFVFLSNLTGDANMFYRADRFLESSLRTPLKPDNEVVEWIHEQLYSYYAVVSDIRDGGMMDLRETHTEFFDRLIRQELGFEEFHQFLDNPDDFLDDYIELSDAPAMPLIAEGPVSQLDSALSNREESLNEELSDLDDLVDIDGDTIVRGGDAFEQYIGEVESRILTAISDFRETLTEIEEGFESADITTPTAQIEETGDGLRDIRSTIEHGEWSTDEERVGEYNQLLASLAGTGAQLMGLRGQVSPHVDDEVSGVGLSEIDDLQKAMDLLSGVAGDERLERIRTELKQIYYLKQTLSKFEEYADLDSDPDSRYKTPWLSLWYVKDLFRAAYYFARFLSVTDDDPHEKIWYVPENYFDSSGQYFTVFYGGDDHSGSEESVDGIVSSHAPYNAEYQGTPGFLQVFMPRTKIPESEELDGEDPPRVVFDYEKTEGLEVDKQERMWIPESIQLRTVPDLTGDSAQNIVRYCPDCLQIMDDRESCLYHGNSDVGKIHGSARVKTVTREREVDETVGELSLCDVVGDVTLEGVSLSITPAKWSGSDIGYTWADEPRKKREIESPDPPLGFTLDTRGLVFDISGFVESLGDDIRKKVSRYKDLEKVDFEYIAHHTAAHYLMQIVSDVSGVNTTMLFYGMNPSTREVFIFERTEGGQGIVDLVFDEVTTDPGSVLEAMNRTGYNSQVINERLWANSDVINSLPTDRRLTEDRAHEVVEEFGEDIPYGSVRDRVAEEFISTADRAAQLRNNVERADLRDAYALKNTIAKAQIEGVDGFPEQELRASDIEASDAALRTAKSLFYSPDIDGCVENLHLSGCISGHEQSDSLSYVVLEELRDSLLTKVDEDDATEHMFDTERIPAAKINDTHIFLDF
jgi:superfamily II DNA/RNA helicase